MIWRDLRVDPPEPHGHCILIFPLINDVGHLYTVSSREYATLHGLKYGYTHWADIEPAPGEAEVEKMIEDDAQ
jgi:hypothetical protein